jgi:hypothetical protein
MQVHHPVQPLRIVRICMKKAKFVLLKPGMHTLRRQLSTTCKQHAYNARRIRTQATPERQISTPHFFATHSLLKTF